MQMNNKMVRMVLLFGLEWNKECTNEIGILAVRQYPNLVRNVQYCNIETSKRERESVLPNSMTLMLFANGEFSG